ncbi:MAG: KH domain-containing protein [Spartobacteria bacterium]
MEEFLRYVLGSLVEFPEDVLIKKTETPSSITFLVAARPSDVPKIIGKSGNTIRALRTLLGASAAKRNMTAKLEIIEP